jgi:2-polyprenyl-6-methoxyphenol hydroxylase-like FAD-dependent oxidoreductase
MSDADVLIVGGGPAGCGAALALANFGIVTAIVAAPKTTVKPTETALPALAGMLRSLNAESALAACEPCFGISSSWGRPKPVLRPSIIDPHGHAWFVHRERFDAALRNSVLRSDTLWFEGVAESVQFTNSHVTVITAEKQIRAKWLIIANGSPAWAAQVTGQTVVKHDSLIALWGRLPKAKTERFLFLEPSEFGWWYLVPDDGPGTIACFMTDPTLARNLEAADVSKWNGLFRETSLARNCGETAASEQVIAASTGLMSLARFRGERWIAIGDAAAKLDPLGSGGTMTAMDGGRRAGRALMSALQGNTSGLQDYERWVTNLVNEFSRQRRQQYHLEFANQSSGFWERRSTAHVVHSQAN